MVVWLVGRCGLAKKILVAREEIQKIEIYEKRRYSAFS